MKRHTLRLASRRIVAAIAVVAALAAPLPAASGAWFTAEANATGSVTSARLGTPTNFTATARANGDTRLSWDAATTQTWATANSVTSGVTYTVTKTFDGSTTTAYSGPNRTYTDPAFAPQPEKYLQVSAGQQHTLARAEDGTVWAWGSNNEGQYGTGSTSSSLTPVQTPLPMRAAVQVEAGNMVSLALLDDGTVWAWGANMYGQLGDGTTTTRTRAVQVKFPNGTFIKALGKSNGIASHFFAVDSDDYLWAWGLNNWGQLGDGTTTDRKAPVQIPNFRVKSIASGAVHAVAIGIDNSLWAWGANVNGQVGDGTTRTRTRPVKISVPNGAAVLQVAAASNSSYAADATGTLRAWGANNWGQLGAGNRSPDATTSPVRVPLSDVSISRVIAGRDSVCILTVDKRVYCWGNNQSATLGDGTTTLRLSAVRNTLVRGLDLIDISIADSTAFAIANDDNGTTMYAWGWNELGQLGTGEQGSTQSPQTSTDTVVEALRCVPGTTPDGSSCAPNSPVTYTLKYDYLSWTSRSVTATR